MAIYSWPIPEALAPLITDDTPQAIIEFLAGQNVAVNAVTVQAEPLSLVLDAETNPVTALKTYQGQPSADQQRLRTAKNVAIAFRDAIEAGQTPTATQQQKALAAVVTLIERFVRTD